MKKLLSIIFLYLLLSFSLVIANFTNLIPKPSLQENQCVILAKFMNNVISKNTVIRKEIVNIGIADYTFHSVANCLSQKLQQADERIVINGILSRGYMHKGILIDYFVFIEEFSKFVSKAVISMYKKADNLDKPGSACVVLWIF